MSRFQVFFIDIEFSKISIKNKGICINFLFLFFYFWFFFLFFLDLLEKLCDFFTNIIITGCINTICRSYLFEKFICFFEKLFFFTFHSSLYEFCLERTDKSKCLFYNILESSEIGESFCLNKIHLNFLEFFLFLRSDSIVIFEKKILYFFNG